MDYKKLILNGLFIILSASLSAQGGANCSLASASPVNLPFSASNQTTCGNGNVYNSGNSTVCGNGVYLDGEDYLYVFTPNTSGLININITSSSSWVGLFLYQGCPSTGLCVSSSTSSSGNQSLSNISVTAGVSYYVVIDNWSVPTCISNFGVNISAPTVAPTPTVQDCLGAIAVCQNVYSEANAYSGTGNIPNEINSGPSCLGSGEKNDVWYTFTTQTAGNVCFTIDPNVNSDDYDWAVYNLTSNSCSDIYNNSALEVSCNYSGTSGNTGPNGNSGSQNEPCIPVQAGQTYVVNVSQFSSSTNGYTIDFSASTASIFDSVGPSLQNITSTIMCGMTSLSFRFSENVICAGILESDFELNGPSGPYTVMSILGTSCNNGANQGRDFTVTITPAITEAGTYSFCMTNTSGSISDLCGNNALSGCVNFDVVYPTAEAGVPDTLSCSSPQVTLSGVGSSVGTYYWGTIGGNVVSGQNTLSPLVNQEGVYFIEVNSNDCISRDTVQIYQNDTILPVADAGLDTLINCYNPTVVLDGSQSSSGSNISYQWTGSFIQSGANTISPIVNGAGTYILTVTNSSNQCTKKDTVIVVEDVTTPGANAGLNDTICPSGELILNGLTTSGDLFDWQTADGNIVLGSNTLTPTIKGGGTYTLTVVNTQNGCQSVSNVVIGEIFVSAIIGANPITGQMPLGVDFINLGVADSSYWDFGNGQIFGDSSNTSSSSITYTGQGDYLVTLISFNGECSDTNRVLIEVIGTSLLEVPNVFTPNGDGKNDVFEFIYRNIAEFNCVIFNRWGKKVAELTSVDQTWGGKNGSDGTYFYVLKAKGLDDVEYDMKGTVTMIK
ncbi:MAG: gliding motility-associated C-terminal domain-containing protein [Flavobacteriales bacterium]